MNIARVAHFLSYLEENMKTNDRIQDCSASNAKHWLGGTFGVFFLFVVLGVGVLMAGLGCGFQLASSAPQPSPAGGAA